MRVRCAPAPSPSRRTSALVACLNRAKWRLAVALVPPLLHSPLLPLPANQTSILPLSLSKIIAIDTGEIMLTQEAMMILHVNPHLG